MSVTMTVEALTAQANADTGVLYGAGPANADLYYWYRYPESCCWSGTRTIDPNGHYNFDLGFGNGASGYVRYTDAGGHRTYLGWAVPSIHLREHANDVWGWVERGVPVTVRLLNSGGAERGVATTTSDNGNGWFNVDLLDAAGNPLIINPNDSVIVEASPATIVPVVPLNAEADAANNRITGSGPANDALNVWVWQNGTWYLRRVTTDSGGTFTADFGDELDIRPGDWVEIGHWNDDDNEVYIQYGLVKTSDEHFDSKISSSLVSRLLSASSRARLTIAISSRVLSTSADARARSSESFSIFPRKFGNLPVFANSRCRTL